MFVPARPITASVCVCMQGVGSTRGFLAGFFSLCLSLSSIMENESRLVDTLDAVPESGLQDCFSGSVMAAIGSPDPSPSGISFNAAKHGSRITYVRGNVLQSRAALIQLLAVQHVLIDSGDHVSRGG